MLEGLLLTLDVFGMILLMRWSIAQEHKAKGSRALGSSVDRD